MAEAARRDLEGEVVWSHGQGQPLGIDLVRLANPHVHGALPRPWALVRHGMFGAQVELGQLNRLELMALRDAADAELRQWAKDRGLPALPLCCRA